MKSDVTTATIVKSWGPDEEVTFDGIKPGRYFFKSNHGSAMNLPVTIPCSDEELAHIQSEGKRWLGITYGLSSCQWWYRFIDAKVFLEEDLSDASGDGPIEDFKFHCINGKVALLQMYVGRGTEDKYNPIYDGNLNYLPYDFLRKNGQEEPLPANADKARDIALELGKNQQYCRVDLYLKGDEIFLGELTYLPNAGRRKIISPELDEMIADHWKPNPPRFHVPA